MQSFIGQDKSPDRTLVMKEKIDLINRGFRATVRDIEVIKENEPTLQRDFFPVEFYDTTKK